MKKPILRQLAIAMTPDGVIGAGKDLLFTSSADLSSFSQFTDYTVLVAGRNTAQQLVDHGVHFRKNRPIVVISESGLIEKFTPGASKFIFYAKNLAKALKLAEELSDQYRLNGYTVIGGARVYTDFVALLDRGETEVNRLYMFTAEADTSEILDPVKLPFTSNQLRLTVRSRQGSPADGVSHSDVAMNAQRIHGDASLGEKVENRAVTVRGKNCRFEWITDLDMYDPSQAHLHEGRIKLYLTTGVVTLRVEDISHWTEREGVNSIEISMRNGQSIDARLRSVPGMNWLKILLNKADF